MVSLIDKWCGNYGDTLIDRWRSNYGDTLIDRKHSNYGDTLIDRWRGNYGGKKQMWFPANYVEEIDSVVETVEPKPLGNLQEGTIDLTGVTVGMYT